jgi:valyl-tRNA synthetase
LSVATIPPVTEEQQKPLAEQLDELGAQLDWVREYL